MLKISFEFQWTHCGSNKIYRISVYSSISSFGFRCFFSSSLFIPPFPLWLFFMEKLCVIVRSFEKKKSDIKHVEMWEKPHHFKRFFLAETQKKATIIRITHIKKIVSTKANGITKINYDHQELKWIEASGIRYFFVEGMWFSGKLQLFPHLSMLRVANIRVYCRCIRITFNGRKCDTLTRRVIRRTHSLNGFVTMINTICVDGRCKSQYRINELEITPRPVKVFTILSENCEWNWKIGLAKIVYYTI